MKALYEDLESMLFQGFLILPVSINGCPIVLKTMNTREYEHVEAYTAFGGAEYARLQACYVLAYSVYLFNRVNVLAQRSEALPRLVEAFRELPETVLKRIMIRVNALNDRAVETLKQVEPYSYGASSRYNWAAYQGHLLNHPSVTGIEGTTLMGINYHQKLWAFYNTREDIQQEYDRQRELAKFQVSAHAPKGIKQIEQQDRDRRREEERRREAMYRGGGREVFLDTDPYQIKVSHESVEDLLGQMRQQMSGQKDYHDLAIARHEERQRQLYEERQRRLQEQRRRSMEEREKILGSNVRSQNAFVIYDEKAVREQVMRDRAQKHENLRAGKYRTASEFEREGEHLSKWNSGEGRPQEIQGSPFGSSTLLGEYYQGVTEDSDR